MPSTSLTVLLVLFLAACGASCTRSTPGEPDADVRLAGTWRAVLESPGGELPFMLHIAPPESDPPAVILNGEERAAMSGVRLEGGGVVLEIGWYDASITARLDGSGDAMVGTWRKTTPGGASTLPFRARRDVDGTASRFEPLVGRAGPASARTTVDGTWSVAFADEDGDSAAVGCFEQMPGSPVVTGTFRTATGDYRFLEGRYERGILRLSCFDGAHAFLFTARARPDGSLAGDFWSRDAYHATWTAVPAEDGTVLEDPWSLTTPTSANGRFPFSFPDLDGAIVTHDDARFEGKVVVVNLFGSWCPNCHDEAPQLAAWDRRYRDRGLEIVGLAFEMSGDAERDRAMVRRYAARHGIEYTLLLAGVSDKEEASRRMPGLSAVLAYPTTVFVDRGGRVRAIHTGFDGPGTGAAHGRLVDRCEALIETMLAAPAG